MKKFLSVLLAVMMVLSTVSFAAPSAVGTYDAAVEAPVFVPETAEDAELSADYEGEYGELVFRIDFENAAVGEIDLSSGVAIGELGATINPAYPNAADLVLKNLDGAYYTEILDDATNYLFYTGVEGTTGLIYLSGNKGLTDKTGSYVLTFDLDYLQKSGNAATPITTRFTAQHTLSPAVENSGTVIWGTVTNENNFREFVARSNDLSNVGSIANVDTFKLFGNSGVASDDEFYIDNIALWYVKDTASVTIDNSAVGAENVVIEEYPTAGMTKADLIAELPYVEGYVCVGFSATQGGELLESLAVGGDTTLYSVWKKQYEYGELVFEIDFNKAVNGDDGAFLFDGDAKYISHLGGTMGSVATTDNLFVVNGADSDKVLGAVVKTRADGDNYMEFTNAVDGGYNMIFPKTVSNGIHFKNDEDGYLVLSYDVLWDENASTVPNRIAFNEDNARENNVEGVVDATKGEWGTVVAYYEADDIGKAGTGGNATTITSAKQINLIKIQSQGSAKAGEKFGIDNIRLFWKPKTAKLTIKVDGQDDIVIEEYPTDGMSFSDLAAMLPAVDGKKFMGFSMNEGGELLSNTKIARDTVVYPVYEEVKIHESSLEFNSDSEISKFSWRTGKNNNLGTGFASIKEDSYMSVSFEATDTTQVVQDTGFNYTLPVAIPANGFIEMVMRVRFTGMPTVTTTLTDVGGGTQTVDPANLPWPEMYYNNASVHDTDNNISISDKNGEWFEISYTPEEMKLSGVELSQIRLDFYNYMPHGTTLDVDYIRFISKPEEEPEVPVCGNCGGEHETEECPENDKPEFDEEWLGEYGELVFEIDFEKLAAGVPGTAFDYDMKSGGEAGKNFLSSFGGKVNPAYSVNESEIYVRNESGNADIVIKEDAEHGKYVEYTITSEGASKNVWDISPYTTGVTFADKDGYFILTADYKQPKDGHLIQIHWNRSHTAEDMVKVEAKETYPAANTWGEFRSIYDADTIGKSTHNPPIASVTEINHVLFYNSSQAAGETYAFDNIRLWWVPKTVDVTVVKGTNAEVSDYTATIAPTATIEDLMNLIPCGDMTLAGLSLTEGGELLDKTAILGFVEDTTLYPKWVGGQTVTVDMGDNTTATPVSMAIKATTTVGEVLAKIVDEGDKKLVGLSRTEGGAVLSSSELINATEEVTTLYAIWEDYEYLTYYSLNFGYEDLGKYRVSQNNAKSDYKLNPDGTLTLKAVPIDGFTATWDQQIYVDTFNSTTALPAGVVSEIIVRMRYRNVPAEKKTYTIQNRADTAFNPADNAAYVHIGKYGDTAWGQNLQSNDRRETNIVDGQWFTRHLDAETYFKEGLAYVRIDTPYPMPDGMEADFDFIRFVGDNDNENIPETAIPLEKMPNFSVDFNEGNDGLSFVSWRAADDNGNVTGFSEYIGGVVGKNSAYVGENHVNYFTWNEEGYVTINFDASADAKAEAEAQGMSAAIYDATAYYKPFDKTAALNAGALEKVQMRVRFRGIPSVDTALWRADNDTVVTYTPASPFYFHVVNDLDSIGTAGALYTTNSVESKYVIDSTIANDTWFVVEFPASFFKADEKVLDTFRIDLDDAMPDGSKMDIDFIYFYGVEDTVESVGPVETPVEPDAPTEKDPGKGDDVRALYSLEFNEDATGASLTSWKNDNGTYKTDDGVNGDKGPGFNSAYIGEGTEGYITWNEDGYVTLNFDASEEAKVAAEAQGMMAALYDPSLYVGSLDKEAYLEAGSFEQLKIRMRLRNFPADGTMVYAADKWGGAGSTEFKFDTYPVYFHYQYEIGALGTNSLKFPKIDNTCTYTEGAYVRDEWFEVTIPAAFFEADVKPLETLRINLPDWTPDGAKIDIDYIRFIGDADADYSPATMLGVSIREKDPVGIRFKAAMSGATNVVADEYGWVAADAEKVEADNLVVGGTGVIVGYGREAGVDVVNFLEENDDIKTFSLVIKNIKMEYANRSLIVKPFVKVDGEYVYGDAISKSVKEIAETLLADNEALEDGSAEKLSAETVEYLNAIVNYSNT